MALIGDADRGVTLAELRRGRPAAAAGGSHAILVGLVGAGIQASLSPRMHEREGALLGLHYRYRLFDLDVLKVGVDALEELLDGAERLGFAGLNITHPCKQAVIPLLDALSDDARAVGAVNTVVFRDGRRCGYNTDRWGFAESFRREMADASRRHVVLLGAGGAGAAVGYALLECGVERLAIVDVDAVRAGALAANLKTRFGTGRAAAASIAAVAGADGVVNATPVGMANHRGTPLAAAMLRRDLWVADIIYFPAETELLRAARALGCRTMGGAGMAVMQAVEAFRLFTGLAPDIERMRRHFRGEPE